MKISTQLFIMSAFAASVLKVSAQDCAGEMRQIDVMESNYEAQAAVPKSGQQCNTAVDYFRANLTTVNEFEDKLLASTDKQSLMEVANLLTNLNQTIFSGANNNAVVVSLNQVQGNKTEVQQKINEIFSIDLLDGSILEKVIQNMTNMIQTLDGIQSACFNSVISSSSNERLDRWPNNIDIGVYTILFISIVCNFGLVYKGGYLSPIKGCTFRPSNTRNADPANSNNQIPDVVEF